VFPRAFEQVKEQLVEDAIVVVNATLEDRAEQPALILKELLAVEAAIARFQGALVIGLDQRDESRLEELARLVRTRKGTNPLFLDVEGHDGRLRRVRCGKDLAVKIEPELLREVENLLGSGRVRLARI